MRTVSKSPDADLDYIFKWEDWLEEDETISQSAFDVPSGIEVHSESVVADPLERPSKRALLWIRGGTAGQSYIVRNRITTSDRRVDSRGLRINVTGR